MPKILLLECAGCGRRIDLEADDHRKKLHGYINTMTLIDPESPTLPDIFIQGEYHDIFCLKEAVDKAAEAAEHGEKVSPPKSVLKEFKEFQRHNRSRMPMPVAPDVEDVDKVGQYL